MTGHTWLRRRLPARLAAAALAAVVFGGLAPLPLAAPAAAAAVPTPPVHLPAAVDAASPYLPQRSCDPVARPGVMEFRDLMLATYRRGSNGGITRGCGVGGTSEHKEGRAWDWMLNVNNSADRAAATAFFAWLFANDAEMAKRTGVMYAVWDKRIWSVYNRSAGWRPYSGNPHTDHIHLSFSWNGAMGRNSFWTGQVPANTDYGPCVAVTGQPAPAYSAPRWQPCPAPAPAPAPTPPASIGGPAARPVVGDFDGDDRADVGWMRDGRWEVRTADGTMHRFAFGTGGDVPVVGDWDGDGRDDIGVFRDGVWHLRDTFGAGPASRSFAFGRRGDQPLVGRWHGSRDGVGVFRAASWFLRNTAAAGAADTSFRYGAATDVPVVGDWDDDGRDSQGVFRPGTRTWHLRDPLGAGAATSSYAYGTRTDRPVVGRWAGARRDGTGIVRGTTWHLRTTPSAGPAEISFES